MEIPGLTIHPEQAADYPNPGEFQLISVPSPEIPTCGAGIELGDLGLAVGADDQAKGLGHMMWSSQRVQERFDPGPGHLNAERFVPVDWNGSTWEYDTDHGIHPFTPAVGDCLLADLDFTANTATPLVEIPGLTIHPEQAGDYPKPGEFQLIYRPG